MIIGQMAETSKDEDSRKRSNDLEGEPDSTSKTYTKEGKLKQERKYAEDGYPEYDDDYDHDHGQGKPHQHDQRMVHLQYTKIDYQVFLFLNKLYFKI